MDIKSSNKSVFKEKGTKVNCKSVQGQLPDEITLRDEIFDLKRQLMILKKTNETNLVKFRKYEDEAKRKDREIEQLMDPRKNADITKKLSIKGAALLMNLKDQNNSLIQMVLNKDLQIKRLLSEIKISKLYTTSMKGKSYKAEIMRLRNLLIKSEKMLKESIGLHHQCKLYENRKNEPKYEIFPSSDQSTPRELEELKSTIQSLENHIKYSNELLLMKDQEIIALKDELNSLRKITNSASSRNPTLINIYETHSPEFPSNQKEFRLHESINKMDKEETEITISQFTLWNQLNLTKLFEDAIKPKNGKELQNSGSCQMPSSNNTTPKHILLSNTDKDNSNACWEYTKKNISHNEHYKAEILDCDEIIPKFMKEIFISPTQREPINCHFFSDIKKRNDIEVSNKKSKERWKSVISKLKSIKTENCQTEVQINIKNNNFVGSTTCGSEINEIEMQNIIAENKYIKANEIDKAEHSAITSINISNENISNEQEKPIGNTSNNYNEKEEKIISLQMDENSKMHSPIKNTEVKNTFSSTQNNAYIKILPKTANSLELNFDRTDKNDFALILHPIEDIEKRYSQLPLPKSSEQILKFPEDEKSTSKTIDSHLSPITQKTNSNTNNIALVLTEDNQKDSHLHYNESYHKQIQTKNDNFLEETCQDNSHSDFDSENSYPEKPLQHLQVKVQQINSTSQSQQASQNIYQPNKTVPKFYLEKNCNKKLFHNHSDDNSEDDDDDDDDVIFP